jgi:hypothetical protein
LRPHLSIHLRFAGFGAVAFIFACVAHEAMGHAGSCLLSGETVELLTSVYFRCHPGSAFVDAAGPLMNLLVAAVAWLALRARVWSPATGAFIALVVGFNAMWGAGYLPYSALTNVGDWTFLFADQGAWTIWARRILFAIAGVWLYSRTMRTIAPYLPAGSPLIMAYVAAMVVAMASVLIFSGPWRPASREALLESAIAPLGLAYIALFPRKHAPSSSALRADVPSRWFWPCAIGIVVAFLAVMGPGYVAI